MDKNYKIVIFILLVCIINARNKNKQVSKFELAYRSCQQRGSACEYNKLDESCVLNCLSKICFETIYTGYILEFGEINSSKKSLFEDCWSHSIKK